MPSRQTPKYSDDTSTSRRQAKVQVQQTLQFISSEMEGVPTVVPSPLAGNTTPLFPT